MYVQGCTIPNRLEQFPCTGSLHFVRVQKTRSADVADQPPTSLLYSCSGLPRDEVLARRGTSDEVEGSGEATSRGTDELGGADEVPRHLVGLS
jgi:hypothetical protein